MPIYEYRCSACGDEFEIIQKLSDATLSRCKKCGGSLEKLFSRTAFLLKGGGWYADGYGGPGSKKGSGEGEAGPEKGSDEGKAAPGKGSGEGKAASGKEGARTRDGGSASKSERSSAPPAGSSSSSSSSSSSD